MDILKGLNRNLNPWERVSKFYESPLFRSLCRKAFDECDVDSSGSIDMKELWIALLLLFDKLNAKLPCHIAVPNKSEVQDLMIRHDKNHNQSLSLDEFTDLAKELLGTRKDFRQSLAVRVVTGIAIKVFGIPALALGIKRSNMPGVDKMNTAMIAGLLSAGPGLLSAVTGTV